MIFFLPATSTLIYLFSKSLFHYDVINQPQIRKELSQEEVPIPNPLSATVNPVMRFSCPCKLPIIKI